MTRDDARRRASARIDALDEDLAARGAWIAPHVTAARALHGHLVGVAADFEDRGGPPPRKDVLERAVTAARDRARAALHGPVVTPTDKGAALLIARRPGHVAALEPLADRLRATGPLRPRWLVFRSDMAQDLTGRGHDTLDAYAIGARDLRLELRAWRSWLVSRARARTALDRALLEELAIQLPLLVLTASAMERVFERLRPAVVVIGNPYTAEGILAAAWARVHRTPIVTIQHGDIAPGQAEWTRADFDVVCVWGETARDTLVAAGVPPSRIAITGAPWRAARAARPVGGRRVLVALSGAGHLVGETEHQAHIRAIDAASRSLADTDWRVRLHPKDSASLWRRCSTTGRYTLLESPGWSIDRDLEWADVLVTATSTAGLDALRLGRDVVSLERAPGDVVPEYVRAGATVIAPPDRLAAVVEGVLSGGVPPATRERAEAFVARTLGPADPATRMRDVVVSIMDNRFR